MDIMVWGGGGRGVSVDSVVWDVSVVCVLRCFY